MATIKGKWRWNEVVNCDYQAHSEYHLNFKSNKIKFDTLKLEWYVGKHELYYWSLNDKVYILAGISANMNEDFYSVKEEYRIMDFGETEQEISEELYAFILANATEYSPIAEKLVEVANNVPKVFEAGKQQGHGEGYDSGYDAGLEAGKELGGYNEGFEDGKDAEHDAFCDVTQQNGNRPNYSYAFAYHNDTTFNPKYDIAPISGCNYIFFVANISAEHFNKVFEKVKIDLSGCKDLSRAFSSFGGTELPFDISVTHCTSSTDLFAWNSPLRTIKKIIVAENNTFNGWFQGDTSLENVTFEGVIGQDINFQWSTLLTRASIESIVNALSDDATGKTLTLSKAAVETAFNAIPVDENEDGKVDWWIGEEWENLVISKPNWIITTV